MPWKATYVLIFNNQYSDANFRCDFAVCGSKVNLSLFYFMYSEWCSENTLFNLQNRTLRKPWFIYWSKTYHVFAVLEVLRFCGRKVNQAMFRVQIRVSQLLIIFGITRAMCSYLIIRTDGLKKSFDRDKKIRKPGEVKEIENASISHKNCFRPTSMYS